MREDDVDAAILMQCREHLVIVVTRIIVLSSQYDSRRHLKDAGGATNGWKHHCKRVSTQQKCEFDGRREVVETGKLTFGDVWRVNSEESRDGSRRLEDCGSGR